MEAALTLTVELQISFGSREVFLCHM